MTSTAPSATEATYRPSGEVSLWPFIPLLAATAVTALVMAWVLWLAEDHCYYFIFTPFIVSLPVFGMVRLTVRAGRCRNPLAGAIVGLLLLTLFYVGYWLTSYTLNVVVHGPVAIHYVQQAGGAPGPLGYFRWRCRNTQINSVPNDIPHHAERPEPFGAYLFYGLELLMLPIAGLISGRSLAGRVYYESSRRWGNSLDVRYGAVDFPVIWNALQTNDWPPVAALARLPKLGGANGAMLMLKLEHLPGAAEEPVYVTVTGMNLGKTLAAQVPGVKSFWKFGKTLARQRAVTGAAAQALRAAFPELQRLASERVPWRQALEDAGLKSRPSTGGDFRAAAIQASQAAVASGARHLNIADHGRSLCLPVSSNAQPELRAAAWYFLKLLGGCFAVFVVGLVLLACNEDDATKQQRVPLVNATGIVLLAAGGVGVIVTLVAGQKLQVRSLLRRAARRPERLFDAARGRTLSLQRLEDARTYHVAKRTPDDIVLCLFDVSRSRLLLEGITHRYVIQGADVTKLTLLDQGPQGVVQINYRIGTTELPLALLTSGYTSGAFAHHPLWAALIKRSARKRFEKFRACLGVPVTA